MQLIILTARLMDILMPLSVETPIIIRHWIKYGINEERSGSPVLDLRYYVEKNSD